MVGVLVHKLHLSSLGDAERQRERERLAQLFHAATLKLALLMYHPNERARRIRYRRMLPHTADLRPHFIYRRDGGGADPGDDPASGNGEHNRGGGPVPSSSSASSPSTSRSPTGRRDRSNTGNSSSSPIHSRAAAAIAQHGRNRSHSHSHSHHEEGDGHSQKSQQEDGENDDDSNKSTKSHQRRASPLGLPSSSSSTGDNHTIAAPTAAVGWLRAHLPRIASQLERFSPVEEQRDPADDWFDASRRASITGDLDSELGRGRGTVPSQRAALGVGPFYGRNRSPDLMDGEGDNDDEEDDEAAAVVDAIMASAYMDGDTRAAARISTTTTSVRTDTTGTASSGIDSGDESDTDLGGHMTYRLDEIIGQGAIGLVYRGALVLPDPLPPMVIAIKHLHLPSTNPHLNRRNFEQLIAAMSLVDHPNILSYYGSHMIDEDCFLFMEYCDGGTLGDWIRKHGPLRDVRILSFWIRQLVQGLEFLGRHGIVHRDIKPSNIMIKDGILKIADFGSAQIHGLCCRKVHDARVVGTPCYIAPEIVAGNQEFQIRGAQDMWSLGCVIYELVLGKPPFSEVDNVWSLYFVLGQYYKINCPPTPATSRLRKLLDYIASYAGSTTLPASSTQSSSDMTKPLATAAGSSAPTSTVSAATAVEATSTPALASTSTDGNPPLDPPAAAPNGSAALGSIGRGATAAAPVDDRTIDDPENGFGALRGHRASVAYKYAAPDAVVMDAAPPASLVTPLDELENPFASTTFVTTSTSSGSSSSHGNAHDTPTTTTTPASPVPGSPVHSTSSPGGGTGPGTPGTPGTAYVTGRDAQGQLQYRFLEPLFPMVPNHHPLLSQMCQVGGIDPMVLDLAEQCLQWDPRRRATALGLLMHPLLRDVL